LPVFKNILLIQLGDIGDVVLTTPTIRAVKETYPEARVSILVAKPFGSLLVSDPNLFEVVETSKLRGAFFSRLRKYIAFAGRLRQSRYDLVIDLRTGDHGAIISLMTRAPVRVASPGNNQFWRKLAFTKILHNIKSAPPPAHPGADQSLRVVREIGISTKDTLPKLCVSNSDRKRSCDLLLGYGLKSESRWITINPYSRWKYKEWDDAKWGRVVDRLWDAYHIPAVVIGSADEAAAAQAIVAGRKDRVFNLAGQTTLGELAAVISMSSLHLGVDSAAPHIAAALDTATVTIHGPTDWRAWRICDDGHIIVTPTMDCVPCGMMGCNGSGKSKCLDELGIEPVVNAALGILRDLPARDTQES